MATVTFSGMVSGIDTESLINATSDATRAAKVTPKEEKISEMKSENSALEELKEMLNNLKTVVDGFSTLNGGAVARSATSTDETVVAASANKYGKKGSYNVEVSSLAKNSSYTLISDTPYTSPTAKINDTITDTQTVDFTIGSPTPLETVSIDVTASTTLADFVSEFNSKSDHATASLINRGTNSNPDYVVMVVSNSSGSENGIATVNIPEELKAGGGGSRVWDTGCVSVAGSDAVFSINGVDVTRKSNTINDVIDGLTFSLSSIGTATVTVDTDKEQTVANLKEFVDLYNEIVEYISKNDEVTREENGSEVRNIYGSLAKTNTDENLLSALRSDISTAKATAENSIRIFADLGITTERDGTLAFKSETLEAALDQDANAVNEITISLGDSMGLTGGTIYSYTRLNGMIDVSINSNNTQISDLNDRIARAEELILKTEENMRARFARLEATMSELQSTSSSLTSLLKIKD